MSIVSIHFRQDDRGYGTISMERVRQEDGREEVRQEDGNVPCGIVYVHVLGHVLLYWWVWLRLLVINNYYRKNGVFKGINKSKQNSPNSKQILQTITHRRGS